MSLNSLASKWILKFIDNSETCTACMCVRVKENTTSSDRIRYQYNNCINIYLYETSSGTAYATSQLE